MNLSHIKKGLYCSFVVREYKKKASNPLRFFIIISLRASEVTITAGRK